MVCVWRKTNSIPSPFFNENILSLAEGQVRYRPDAGRVTVPFDANRQPPHSKNLRGKISDNFSRELYGSFHGPYNFYSRQPDSVRQIIRIRHTGLRTGPAVIRKTQSPPPSAIGFSSAAQSIAAPFMLRTDRKTIFQPKSLRKTTKQRKK